MKTLRPAKVIIKNHNIIFILLPALIAVVDSVLSIIVRQNRIPGKRERERARKIIHNSAHVILDIPPHPKALFIHFQLTPPRSESAPSNVN